MVRSEMERMTDLRICTNCYRPRLPSGLAPCECGNWAFQPVSVGPDDVVCPMCLRVGTWEDFSDFGYDEPGDDGLMYCESCGCNVRPVYWLAPMTSQVIQAKPLAGQKTLWSDE